MDGWCERKSGVEKPNKEHYPTLPLVGWPYSPGHIWNLISNTTLFAPSLPTSTLHNHHHHTNHHHHPLESNSPSCQIICGVLQQISCRLEVACTHVNRFLKSTYFFNSMYFLQIKKYACISFLFKNTCHKLVKNHW
jgi:hypothetical protein